MGPSTGSECDADCDERIKRRCQPLEVDDSGGQVGLDLHICEAAPDGTRQTVPGFGFAMEAFGSPAVALIETPVFRAPALAAAPRAKQSRVIVPDNNSLVGAPFREAIRP